MEEEDIARSALGVLSCFFVRMQQTIADELLLLIDTRDGTDCAQTRIANFFKERGESV
jgi:hypothetical protein